MLSFYNTATRSIEEFPPQSEPVGLYTCGPTVYNYAHIGNLRTYIFEDVLKRVLVLNEFKVKHIMNVTDVGHLTSDADTGEDKMEKGAAREGKSVWEIASHYLSVFRDDFHALNCLDPDIWCKATDHISEQIALIQRLEEKGCTYRAPDGIYFDTSTFPRYPAFARLDLEKLRAGARVAVAEGKRNPADFALWKFSPADKKRQMEWDSPWGKGFPGWHVECSAMAMKYLGETLDIHCGGIDHIPVHHTNEIAQSEAATGKPFSRFWLHGEFLVMEKAKMAKSGGNFITISVLRERGYDPLDYRYMCFSAHYRSPLTFSWEALDGARNGLASLREHIRIYAEEGCKARSSEAAMDAAARFQEQANHDLNMPGALAVLWTTLRSPLTSDEKLAFLSSVDTVLGLGLFQPRTESIDQEIEKLIADREQARKDRNFALADQLRNEITKRGIILEDTPKGTRWHRK